MADEKMFTKYLKNLKGKGFLLILGVLGVLLLVFGGGIEGSDKSTLPDIGEQTEAYRASLEQELASLCEQVAGVGEVTLMLTLEGSEKAVYAQDSKQNGTVDYVISSGQGLLLYREYPAVTGVAVVCTGGGDPAVQRELTDLLSALLGIGTNRIAITKG